MLVGNDARRDPRVRKEALALAGLGVRVVVVAISKSGGESPEDAGGYHVWRIPPEGWVRSGAKAVLARTAPAIGGKALALLRKARGIPEKVPAPESVGPPSDRSRQLLIAARTHRHQSRVFAEAAVLTRARVVHAHDLDMLLPAYWASKVLGSKLVFDAHEIWWAQEPDAVVPDEWRRYFLGIEARLITRADVVFTVSDAIADFFATRYGIVRPVLVRNAVQPPRSLPEHATRAPVEVLFHGGFIAHRGLEEVIEAAKRFENARLVLRGSGALEEELRLRVASAGLQDRVTFEPPVPMSEVITAAARSDIGLIPYKPLCLNNELALPNKVFEYLAAGLAIAGSNLVELERVLDHGRLGAVFDPMSPASIAAAVNRLAADLPALETMRARARAASRDHWTWSAEKERLLAAYEPLLDGSRGQAP